MLILMSILPKSCAICAKKLRDIETLEKKLADGSVAKPEPEQLEKVARKPVMLEEIAELEAAVAKMSASENKKRIKRSDKQRKHSRVAKKSTIANLSFIIIL